ncbi:hypothetical protein HN011_003155 [Eciton burchellii]|nr:hypothetical protein HN011_003155 [Eciton burchellii]
MVSSCTDCTSNTRTTDVLIQFAVQARNAPTMSTLRKGRSPARNQDFGDVQTRASRNRDFQGEDLGELDLKCKIRFRADRSRLSGRNLGSTASFPITLSFLDSSSKRPFLGKWRRSRVLAYFEVNRVLSLPGSRPVDEFDQQIKVLWEYDRHDEEFSGKNLQELRYLGFNSDVIRAEKESGCSCRICIGQTSRSSRTRGLRSLQAVDSGLSVGLEICFSFIQNLKLSTDLLRREKNPITAS